MEAVVTKREQFATFRQHIRPKSYEAALEVFGDVLNSYKASKMTGPVTLNFSQGALTVIAYDQIVRVPDGSPADKAIFELFAKSVGNSLTT